MYEVLYFAVLLDRCLMHIYSISQYFQFVNAQNKMFSQLQNSIRVVINVNGIYHAHFRHFERTTPFRIVSIFIL
jgi:hypothetical protein